MMRNATIIIVMFITLGSISCMNKLTKKISFRTIYKPGEDSFQIKNISISYPALVSKKNTWIRIEAEYMGEKYDTLRRRLLEFDNYLETQLPYFNEFKFRTYSINSFTIKRNTRFIDTTHVQLIHTLGIDTYAAYPVKLSSEIIHKRIKDSLKTKKMSLKFAK